MITKKELKKKSVAEVLTMIYNHEIHDDCIKTLDKDKLSEFVSEVFNKGILSNYLNLK